MQPQKILILDNIRSVINVGAIFRTADAAGVQEIYLVGYTPEPIDRFGRVRKDFIKASLGAESSVTHKHFETLPEAIAATREKGCKVYAVEQSEESVSVLDFKPVEPYALILGNEVDGVSPTHLALCDKVLEIPMLGQKESLNVSVSAGVVLYLLLKK